MKVYFVTNNEKKAAESKDRLERFIARVPSEERARLQIELCIVKRQLDELLATDIEKIVRKKALEAYRIVHLPCVVEHGGLYLDAWRSPHDKPGLLGGIGQIVWDSVGDRMCAFLRNEDARGAVAQSIVGYCDGMRIRVYSGETRGEITDHARGQLGFRWDPIFKPQHSDLTYGEMAPEKKRETAPDEEAWNRFFKSLKEEVLKSRRK